MLPFRRPALLCYHAFAARCTEQQLSIGLRIAWDSFVLTASLVPRCTFTAFFSRLSVPQLAFCIYFSLVVFIFILFHLCPLASDPSHPPIALTTASAPPSPSPQFRLLALWRIPSDSIRAFRVGHGDDVIHPLCPRFSLLFGELGPRRGYGAADDRHLRDALARKGARAASLGEEGMI
jgi:hypothetical protein